MLETPYEMASDPDVIDLVSEDEQSSDDEVELAGVFLNRNAPSNSEIFGIKEEKPDVKAETQDVEPELKSEVKMESDEDDVQIIDGNEDRLVELGEEVLEDNYEDVEDAQVTKLFVGYLPQQFRTNDLIKLCVRFGPIADCEVLRDKATDSPKGWGYVEYEFAHDAAKAKKSLNGLQLGPKTLKVADFKRIEPQSNVVVSSVDSTLTEENLKDWFEPFGEILSVKVLDNQSMGFVRFASSLSAKEAVESLNGDKLKVFLHTADVTKVKNQYYANYIQKVEESKVIKKLKDKNIIPKHFKPSLNVKRRLGIQNRLCFKGKKLCQRLADARRSSVDTGNVAATYFRSRTSTL